MKRDELPRDEVDRREREGFRRLRFDVENRKEREFGGEEKERVLLLV